MSLYTYALCHPSSVKHIGLSAARCHLAICVCTTTEKVLVAASPNLRKKSPRSFFSVRADEARLGRLWRVAEAHAQMARASKVLDSPPLPC